MELIRITEAELAYGDAKILDNADLRINQGERVCLVGRNGAGKSSLLKVISGQRHLDDGQLIYSNDIRIAMLEQDPPETCKKSVFDYVSEGLKDNADLIRDFELNC